MNAAVRLALGAAALAVLYLALLPSIEVADVVAALVAAVVLLRAAAIPDPTEEEAERRTRFRVTTLLHVPRFGYLLLRSVARGAWAVALMSIGLRPISGPGVVEVRIGDRPARAASLFGLLVTLSPGSVLLDVDPERGTMRFHVIGQSEREFREEIDRLWSATGAWPSPRPGR